MTRIHLGVSRARKEGLPTLEMSREEMMGTGLGHLGQSAVSGQ